MTKYPDIFAALAAPFEAHEVRVKPTRSGQQLHYITARVAMNRLDEVLGPENWWDEFLPTEHSVLCKLTICLPDGRTVTKQDAGGYAGMETRTRSGEMVRDDENDEKSGFSDAFKRAAAKFGVARYLYRDGVPNFVREHRPTAAAHHPAPAREPGSDDDAAPRHDYRSQGRSSQSQGSDRAPRSGRGLFAAVKELEAKHGVGLLQYVNKWAKHNEFPSRMVDFNEEQVAMAWEEIQRKVQAHEPGSGDPYAEALEN